MAAEYIDALRSRLYLSPFDLLPPPYFLPLLPEESLEYIVDKSRRRSIGSFSINIEVANGLKLFRIDFE